MRSPTGRFYAIRGLTSPSGQPTNAIYGFINMLAKLESQVLPTHAVVVWDGGLDAERVEELDDYKGQARSDAGRHGGATRRNGRVP